MQIKYLAFIRYELFHQPMKLGPLGKCRRTGSLVRRVCRRWLIVRGTACLACHLDLPRLSLIVSSEVDQFAADL